MQPLLDVAAANSTNSLDHDTFQTRYDRLKAEIDSALTACSNAVSEPVSLMMYKYALANAPWTFCTNGTVPECDTKKIQKALQQGQAALGEAQAAVDAT